MLNFKQNIRKYIEWQDDQMLSVRLNNVVFSEEGIKYHGICRLKYQVAAEAKIKHKEKEGSQVNSTVSNAGYWYFNREVHKKAYEALSCYLKETVTKNKEVLLLVDLNRYYQHLLTKFGGEEFIDVTSSSQKLEERTRKHNGDDILISSGTSRKGNVVYLASMSLKKAVKKEDFKDNYLKGKVLEMTLMLRKEIFRAKKPLLPKDLTL